MKRLLIFGRRIEIVGPVVVVVVVGMTVECWMRGQREFGVPLSAPCPLLVVCRKIKKICKIE